MLYTSGLVVWSRLDGAVHPDGGCILLCVEARRCAAANDMHCTCAKLAATWYCKAQIFYPSCFILAFKLVYHGFSHLGICNTILLVFGGMRLHLVHLNVWCHISCSLALIQYVCLSRLRRLHCPGLCSDHLWHFTTAQLLVDPIVLWTGAT